jgi:hypothetical protein
VRTIIAGSRSATFADTVQAIHESEWDGLITEVVCGMAIGADLHGQWWALTQGLPVAEFHADWDNIDAPGTVVRYRRDGTAYNALAGLWRNQQMADYGEALIAAWDGRSSGTRDMIQRAEAGGLWVYVRKFS